MATESFDSVFKLTKESSEWLLKQMEKPVKHETPSEAEARNEWIRKNELLGKKILAKMKTKQRDINE